MPHLLPACLCLLALRNVLPTFRHAAAAAAAALTPYELVYGTLILTTKAEFQWLCRLNLLNHVLSSWCFAIEVDGEVF